METRVFGSVLIVRHGENRGRIRLYGQHILDWLEAERPELWRHVRLHSTGQRLPRMDGLAGVVFWLADPLEGLYPSCYEEAVTIQKDAEARGLAIVNRPTVLGSYGKGFQATKWKEAGLPSPPAIRVDSIEDIRNRFARESYPLLARGSQSFSQTGTLLIKSPTDLRRLEDGDLPSNPVISPLIDVREGFRKTKPDSVRARLYHKKRALVIDREVVPDSLYFSRKPVVSADTWLLAELRDRQRHLKRFGPLGRRASKLIMRSRLWKEMIRSEEEFIGSPVAEAEVLRSAAEAVGLEFLGFDYSDLANGEIVLWEANPYPYVPSVKSTRLSHVRPTAEKVKLIYAAFAKCLSRMMRRDS